jgi:hypothetical protein
MTDEHRADVEKVRKVAEEFGSPGQDRDPLQDEIRRRQAAGHDKPPSDRDAG